MAAHKNGLEQEALNQQLPPAGGSRALRLGPEADDLGKTRSAGRLVVIVKGAFDVMAAPVRQGRPGGPQRRKNDEMSRQALRVLAVGYKEIPSLPAELSSEELENGLALLGLVGMIDPPPARGQGGGGHLRAKAAGIKPVMITAATNVVTASAHRHGAGHPGPGGPGPSPARSWTPMNDKQLDENVEAHRGVRPGCPRRTRSRIVKAWQRKGPGGVHDR